MGDLLRLEWYKLWRDKTFYAVLAVTVFLGSCISFDGYSVTGMQVMGAALHNANLLILPVCVFPGLFIGREFGEGTIFYGIETGHSRLQVFLAKAAVFFIGCEVLMLAFPVLNVLFHSLAFGFGGPVSAEIVLYLIKAAGIVLVLNAASMAFGLFLGFLFRDVAKTIGIALFIFGILTFVLNLYGAKLSFLNYVIPMAAERLLLSEILPAASLWLISGAGAGWIAVLGAGAFFCFARRALQ
ncbi:ABC transporter permease [Eubacterium sp. 1001713B170207_170306_E7]|uniref:ABC transporter permease n=1 Tax=Eubacterium sp. 1001713B170207_170306_E7 TaxID=2787097 RepID=UPI00189A6FFF|nr:ABC transporter permease [Eubacterium sp. 1001713B170207_170306_E7]